MAAANSLTVAEEIQILPRELREKIYKHYINIKLREKNENGWEFVHEAIEEAPFCERHKKIVKLLYCWKCRKCEIKNLCNLCYKKGVKHYLDYQPYNIYDEIFIKFI